MDKLSVILDRLLPQALDLPLRWVLGDQVPRLGEGGRFRIRATGSFSGRLVGDLLGQVENQDLDGALVFMEPDVCRVFFFARGKVIGASSDVVFEQLGSLLLNAGTLDEQTAERLLETEELGGVAAVVPLLPPETVAWVLEHRVREVAAALYLMAKGHYVFVEGRPDLGGVPEVSMSPMGLAMEGMRRYDEWRNRPIAPPRPESVPDPVRVGPERGALVTP